MRSALRCLHLGLIAAVVAGCESTGVVCTEEFRVATVVLIDATSAPVTDAVVTTTLVRTGQIVLLTSIIDFISGTYPVLDDGAVPLFHNRMAEDFRLTVTRPGQTPVTAMYRFTVPGGCHIEKVSGADTLSIP